MSFLSNIAARLSHNRAFRNVLYHPLAACAFLWRRLMFRTTFIAVTGSVGKSTATASLATILSAQAPTNWVRGGRNNRFFAARAILRTRFRHRFTVVEVGTRSPGEMRRAGWLVAPDVVLMLRVLSLHSDVFPELEQMAAEKAQLLRHLGPHDAAILNADDPLVMAMRAQCRGRVFTFGLTPGSLVTASDVSSKLPGRLTFQLHCGQESGWVETRLVGEHMLTPALGAAAAALMCGVPLAKVAKALGAVRPLPGRMQPVPTPNGAIFLRDEFNGAWPTVEAALTVLREAKGFRRIAVMGDMLDTGLCPEERARLLGELVAASADLAVFVGDLSDLSAKAAMAAGQSRDSVFAFDALPEAAAFLRHEVGRGDLALLKGSIGRHIERIVLGQLGSLSCQLESCPKQILCDNCAELGFVPISLAATEPAGALHRGR